MADRKLQAELQVRFGVKAKGDTFELELDDDPEVTSPFKLWDFFTFTWQWTDEQYESVYADVELMKPKENGSQGIRVYSPQDVSLELFCTEVPVKVPTKDTITRRTVIPDFVINNAQREREEVDPFFKDFLNAHGPILNLYTYSGIGTVRYEPIPVGYQKVGRFETEVIDVLRWENSRAAFAKYSYLKEFAVGYASAFINAKGRRIPAPVFVPELGGAFIASENCFGAISITYRISYTLFKVIYGMPAVKNMKGAQLAWLRGDISTFKFPSIAAIAVSPLNGLAGHIEFERRFHPVGASLVSWNPPATPKDIEPEAGPVNLDENTRQTETVRIENPSDPAQYIDVQRATSITLYDQNGRPYSFNLNP